MKRIAALVVNWNKEKDVLILLSQLKSFSDNSYDIYIVDNASTDNSVRSIQKKHPDINLILNRVNLGGTGGFNTGLEFICRKNQYKYVWLLDNDARVTDTTLKELVIAMDVNKKIGLAGSRIQDIDKPSVIVETGANFRWDTIGVIPVNRNSMENPTRVLDVDYVAVCSALVRVSAMKQVGVMDDRIFLCWDDMDWGLCFKKQGYRVVAVTKSIAYHGSFIERDRGDVSNYYYGIRNALLVYSKHTPVHKRLRIFFNSLRYYQKLYFFFIFHNNKFAAGLIQKALFDYYHSRWGKIRLGKLKMNSPQIKKHLKIKTPKKILVSLIGTSYTNGMEIISQLNELYPQSKIHILITRDRENYFKEYSKIMIDGQKSNQMVYLFNSLVTLYKKHFDIVVTSMPTPFIYVASKVMFYNINSHLFSVQNTGLFRLHRIVLSNMLGELTAVLFFPFILHRSFKYKKK